MAERAVQPTIESDWQRTVHMAVAELIRSDAVRRTWQADPALWTDASEQQAAIAQRLGWLTVLTTMRERLQELRSFANQVRSEGFEHAVLCGMGGSSLCPEVLRQTFGSASGYPRLWVLDSTDPAAVGRVAKQAPVERTIYLIASKSGGTIEVDALFRFFFERAQALVPSPGSHFAAITDEGTKLHDLAVERSFRQTFLNPADIGGRYSALSLFGLVPAALIGMDLDKLLSSAEQMAETCGPPSALRQAQGKRRGETLGEPENPGLWLGARLGAMAKAGRDKLTLLLSPGLSSFGLWVEQLVAESCGKDGRGMVPIVDEPPGPLDGYGDDRFFAYLRLEGDENGALDRLAAGLEASGQPIVTMLVQDRYELGGEFFRWQFATAIAGAMLQVNPFDEPNVQESKERTARVLLEYGSSGRLPSEAAEVHDGDIEVYGANGRDMAEALHGFLGTAKPGDYAAVLAYLPSDEPVYRALQRLRTRLLDRRLPSTLGFGPRYLHSTGQLHKGGPDSGLFVQLTADDPARAPVPGQPYDFGTLWAAQALGDWQALRAHGRRALKVHLGRDALAGLERLIATLEGGAA